MEKFLLTKHDFSKIREFFEPRVDQVQIFTSSKEVVRVLKGLGYEPTNESSDDMYYFEIPERFRNAIISRTVREHKTW